MDWFLVGAAQDIDMDRRPFMQQSLERARPADDGHEATIVVAATILEIRRDNISICGEAMQVPIFVDRRHQ